MNQLTTTARVQITVEVTVGSWGDDCTNGHVFKQSSEQARGLVANLIHERKRSHGDIKIVGEPSITTITQVRT